MANSTADDDRTVLVRPRSVPRATQAPVLSGAPTADPLSFVVAWVAMFVLSYDFPTDWFRVDADGLEAGTAAAQGFVPAVLVLAAGFAFVSTLHIAETYLKLVALEPLLASFVVLLLVSFLWSDLPATTVRFALPLVVVLYLGYWMVSVFRLDQLLAIFLTVLVMGTLLQFFFVFALPQYGQSAIGFSGTLGNKNALGRLMAFSTFHFVLGAGVFPRYRVPLIGFAGMGAFLVIGSESATSLAGLLFVLGMIVLCKVFRARRTLYGAIAVGLIGGGGLSIFVATANLVFLTGLLGKDVTLTGRTQLWELSIREALDRPLLGYGWGAFWQGFLSSSRPILDASSWTMPHAHNALIDYFLTVGIVGVLLAVGFFLRFVIRAARAVRNHPGTLGLWPIAVASFSFVFSITEFGVVSRSIFFLMLVIHISVVSLDRRRPTAPLERNPRSEEAASQFKTIEVVLP